MGQDWGHQRRKLNRRLHARRKEYGTGLGASKKEAEQEASRQAWEKLKDISSQQE